MLKQTLAALALLFVTIAPAVAQAPAVPAEDDGGEPDKLSGFGFGAAVNYTFDDEIESAFLDTNGIVRTNEKTRGDVAFILEGHFLSEEPDTYLPPFLRWLEPISFGVFKRNCNKDLICGMGPFLAVKTGGSTELIESVGVGYMWGTKHRNGNGTLGGLSQWNFGLGISIDPHVNRLAQGIHQGEPLPLGETEIRYEDDVVFGAMMIFSVGIG